MKNMYVYLLYLSSPAHSLMSSYCSVWRTERNGRTVNAQGAPYLMMQAWRTEQGRALVGCTLLERGTHMYIFFSFFCMAN